MKNTPVKVINKKRIAIGFVIIAALMILLAFRVAWIQIVDADDLTEKAIGQQTSDITIEAKRGAIYDRNGKELATSITCYTLWARPAQISENMTSGEITELAETLAPIVEMKAGEVRKKLVTEQALVKISQYLEKDAADKVRDLEITGLELSEATRRYYPLGNFASQVLGSVTIDNTGRTGIELEYDQYLSGIDGRWVKNTDVVGNVLVDGSEEYFEAEDGLNVVLTIDEAIQYYVEKSIEKGMKDTEADRIMCLAMDPKTGEILASAITPGFDPNNATEPDDEKEKKAFFKLKQEDQMSYLFDMWRNPIVSDNYEPGSTFKIITSTIALEEGKVSVEDTFSCPGFAIVEDRKIRCHKVRGHGGQNFAQGLQNSCSPVFINVGARVGVDNFYKYLRQFGLLSKTGIDLPGEAGTIIHKQEDVGPVELATMSFGQSFQITPIQLATTVSSIINGGTRITPHFGVQVLNEEGEAIKVFQYEKKD
mgnify:CR=1 FL=1